MIKITILIFVFSVFAHADYTCYAKAGLGVYDKHGLHVGHGKRIRDATQDAMLDCRKAHPLIGCIPVPGCREVVPAEKFHGIGFHNHSGGPAYLTVRCFSVEESPEEIVLADGQGDSLPMICRE